MSENIQNAQESKSSTYAKLQKINTQYDVEEQKKTPIKRQGSVGLPRVAPLDEARN